ncbi:MAG: hypothetical protein AB1704_04060 [Pseudomonadota bacterium]|jgi:hypothetical protein|uniref:hypothetical protein n=1 Tax=Burkholderiaceae TaxID=119060 RepID=UPI0010F690ED|nr:hypothetical protein [Burkholderia sp. 4M9327F10]
MSAPDSSNSKAPPSLLPDTAQGSQANGSRILANLEGRVAPPTDKPRRSKAPAVLVALLVVAAGGWGAWHLQQRARNGHAEVAAAPAPEVAQAAASAAGASSTQALAKAAPAESASASQAATIVADDTDNKDSKPSAEAAASTAGGIDDNRLSRALANGAEVSGASAPATEAASGAKPAATAASHAHHETATAHAKHDAANTRHASATAVAQEKKDKQRTAHNAPAGSKDDPDADLLAALVARTKPATPKADTTKVSAATGNPKLAEQVKECGTRGFFEDQLCRWRVCEGHWGKDPSCPGAAAQQPNKEP